MKLNSMVYVTLLGMLALPTYAQEGRSDRLTSELDREVHRLYNQSGGPELDKQEQVRVEVPSNMEQRPVVIMGSTPSSPAPAYVEKRPTTYIEASPLEESKAARMRRQRESMEAETEMRIVEKLESDRMESERERAERIFGDKWDRRDERSMQPQAQEPTQPQIIVVSPQQQEGNDAEKTLEKEDFKQDLRSIVSELKSVEKEEDLVEVQPEPQYYMVMQGGAGVYPGLDNVKGAYSVGFAVGADFFTGLLVEAGFNVSSYDLDPVNCAGCGYGNLNLMEIKQSNVSFALKHKFSSSSRLSPVVGGVASLNMREYKSAYGSGSYDSVKSNAVDLGLLAGADVNLSSTWSVGADVRYMFNVTSRVDRSNRYYGQNSGIEEKQYYLFNVNARFNF